MRKRISSLPCTLAPCTRKLECGTRANTKLEIHRQIYLFEMRLKKYTFYKKKRSVDLGYHTRCHTRYAPGTHTHQRKETPSHSNGAKAHTRQVRSEFRQRSRRPLHRRGPPRPAAPASDSSRAISHAAAMCSATDMRCAINADHVQVVPTRMPKRIKA